MALMRCPVCRTNMTKIQGLAKKKRPPGASTSVIVRGCTGRAKLRPHAPLAVKYLALSVNKKSGKPKLVYLRLSQYHASFDALANYRAFVAARSKWKKTVDNPLPGRHKKNDSAPMKCPFCAQKLDFNRRASSLSGLPWPAGTLVYECLQDKTFFFIVRENDPGLVDLLDGSEWERWVTEEYSPYQYEGKIVKVVKPEFARLNL